MSANLIYIIWAILAGTLIAFQPLINVQLSQVLSSSWWASVVSFTVGMIFLLTVALIFTKGVPSPEWKNFQWWMLLGGVFGAFLLAGSIFIVPRLGLTAFIGIVIASQLIMALILDHIGFLSDTAYAITPQRTIGVALLIIGAVLTQRL